MATRRWLHSHLFHSPLSNNQEVGEAVLDGLPGTVCCVGCAVPGMLPNRLARPDALACCQRCQAGASLLGTF
jgi:hypothetical protein